MAPARWVLYVSTMFRRAEEHAGLALAGELARAARLPVVVCEPLSDGYAHATRRSHGFILDAVRENAQRFAKQGVRHVFLWTKRRSILADPRFTKLTEGALRIVADDSPVSFQPGLVARLPRVTAADAFGLCPASEFPKEEIGARTLRPKIAKRLPFVLDAEPLGLGEVEPSLDLDIDLEESDPAEARETSGIDQTVREVPGKEGGRAAALARLRAFLKEDLEGYAEERNDMGQDRGSGLSPWLHFGHLAAVEVARVVRDAGAPAADRDAFLEQLIVRRELGLNLCANNRDFRSVKAVPPWALETLRARPRAKGYSLEELDAAATDDEVWNAAQTELVVSGTIHGYARMLWGKKIVEWAPTPEKALAWMIHLNDRYALDGRDPVSYGNFLWCLGKHDRPFPSRPGFGRVRSMTTGSARKKFDVDTYLDRVARLVSSSS